MRYLTYEKNVILPFHFKKSYSENIDKIVLFQLTSKIFFTSIRKVYDYLASLNEEKRCEIKKKRKMGNELNVRRDSCMKAYCAGVGQNPRWRTR